MPRVISAWAKAAFWYVLPWTAIAILWALQWGDELPSPGNVNWNTAFALSAINFYSTAIVSIPLTYIVWRRGLLVSKLYRSLALYAAVAAITSIARFAMFVPLHNWLMGSAYGFWSDLRIGFVPQFAGELTVIAVVLAIRYVQVANELTWARLEALQGQLHPHFLFNTLHAVSTLMHRDVDEADEMLVRLCDLLRSTLHRPQRTLIPLSEELTILKQYVDIMDRRFPGRLRLAIEVPAHLEQMLVPPLLLQPLVENVLRHGLDESGELTEVRISVERADRVLQLRVADNGRGLQRNGAPPRLGIGLENTRRRMETIYGKHARLTIGNTIPTGTEVLLTLPCGAAS